MFNIKIDWKLLAVFLMLVGLSVAYVSHQSIVKAFIKLFLTWPHLPLCIWLFVIVSFVVHYLSVKSSKTSYDGLIYKAFGKFADSAFAAITYGLALTTSASILKGVYIQQIVKDGVYFNNFDEVDIYSMLVVCLFLFAYSVYATSLALVNALFISAGSNIRAV